MKLIKVGVFVFFALIVVGELEARVPMVAQETENWCWAATAQMVLESLGEAREDVAQCKQARMKGTCEVCPSCQGGLMGSTGCAFRSWPDFEAFGFTPRVGGELKWEELYFAIHSRKQPVAFVWQYRDESQHMMLAVDVFTKKNVGHVLVFDPWPTCGGCRFSISYKKFLREPGFYWLAKSFFDFSKVGSELKGWDSLASDALLRGAGEYTEEPLPAGTRLLAAEQGLASLMEVVSTENFRSLGFSEFDGEFDDVSLGVPLSEFYVGVDRIAKFAGGSGFELLEDTSSSAYPVVANGANVLNLKVVGEEDGWRMVAFGYQPLKEGSGKGCYNEVFRKRAQIAEYLGLREEDIFKVDVPGLGLAFLGWSDKGKLFLAPVFSGEGLGAGEHFEAEEVFRKLVEPAKSRGNLPG